MSELSVSTLGVLSPAPLSLYAISAFTDSVRAKDIPWVLDFENAVVACCRLGRAFHFVAAIFNRHWLPPKDPGVPLIRIF